MKLFKAILLTIIYFVSLEVISLWALLIPQEIKYLDLLKVLTAINMLVNLIILMVVFKLIKRSDLLILEETKNKFYLFAMFLGIGFVFFQSILNIIYDQEIPTDMFIYNFTLDRLTSLNVIAAILIVPITEELYFRKYIQGGLTKNYKPYQAILVSSILFAVIHIPFVSLFYEFSDFSLHHAFITMFGGIISGILFYQSKSIIPSILFHLFWNLTSYIV